MTPFVSETGVAAPVEGRNIDTDQIIPARFLKVDKEKGYGQFLFYDHRFDENRNERPQFVLNQPAFREARILVADVNFGCGSSREGAVYALQDYGVRAVIAPSFGDIFYNNCLKNGVVPVRLDETVTAELRATLAAGPERRVTVDLAELAVTLPGGAVHRFDIDPFWRECLMKGIDEIGLTQTYMPQIEEFEREYYAQMPWLK